MKNVFVIYCHKDDYDFLIQDYAAIKEDSIKEFELPKNTEMKVEISDQRKAGRISTYFNGSYYGDIVIQDEKPKDNVRLH